MKPVEQNRHFGLYPVGPVSILGIGAVSLVYFADILIRASQKCFWFDELCTVFLCRLPTFRSTYTAVAHGADFNPPLFYLLTRISQRIFGEGLIATRLPEMVGVWLFCLCLFLFAARRTGPLAGFVAAALPLFAVIHYYAYEARPHGLVLGWSGLALVFWQRAKEGLKRELWLTGLGLVLVGALLTHVYAVYLIIPFAAVEIHGLLRGWRVDKGALTAVLLPLVAAIPVYVPLYRTYRRLMPTDFAPASLNAIDLFLLREMGPAILVLLFAAFLIVVGRKHAGESVWAPRFSHEEIALTVAFATLPLAGWIGALLTRGPFIFRYFLSSVAGYSILLAWAVSRPRLESWVIRILAGSMLLLLVADLAAATHEYRTHSFVLFEPSTRLRLTTTPNDPMALYSGIASADHSLDILVASPLEYLYLFSYSPPNIASRLFFVESPNEHISGLLLPYKEWAKVELKMAPLKPFLANHKRLLVYIGSTGPSFLSISSLLTAGYKLKSERASPIGTLYEIER